MADRVDTRAEGGFEPRPLSEDVGLAMARASHALGTALVEGVAPLGLSLRGYTVLSAARRAALEGKPRRQLALARAVGLDKSVMVVTLDELEEKGLVERRPDPDDRRAHAVDLTREGLELLARAEGVVRAVEDEAFADLGEEERRTLLALLSRLVAGRLSRGVEHGSCL